MRPRALHATSFVGAFLLVATSTACFLPNFSAPPIPPPSPQAFETLRRQVESDEHPVGLHIEVDTALNAVIAYGGPFQVPPMDPSETEHHHGAPMAEMNMAPDDGQIRFDWPVEGWVRGFELRVYDQNGVELPSELVHHFVVINFDRREMLYSTVERLLAVGQETGDVILPTSMGVPLDPGQRMGMYAMWHNMSGKEMEVYFRLVLRWTPVTADSRPRAVLPINMDVNHLPGASSGYDLPPGRTTRSYEFVAPLDGKLLAVAGHLHDFGEKVWLEEAESGKKVAEVKAIKDENGHTLAVEQKKRLGFFGRGKSLHAGRTYRLVAEYDNPLGHELPMGAMGFMLAVFAPEDWQAWPEIDPTDPGYRTDVATWGLDLTSVEFMKRHRHGGGGGE